MNGMSMASFYSLLGMVVRIFLLTVFTFEIVQAGPYRPNEGVDSALHLENGRQLLGLVEPPPLWLSYQGGTIFSGHEVPVYIIWYGRFSPSLRALIVDFFASFQPYAKELRPSVRSWWALTSDYKDSEGSPVASAVELKQEVFDDYSMGRYLTEDHVEGLLGRALGPTFPVSQKAFYLVLTADDVYVEGFCTQRCASHFTTRENLFSAPPGSVGQKIPFAWVGNAASQCPGKCAWPFAKGEYGYETNPLKSASGDVGAEGMIMNIAAMLAGTATNPLSNGFYQGDEDLPFESATACAGVFGPNAYSGFPGELQIDGATGASFNANGINDRKYLLPALWSPVTSSCRPPMTEDRMVHTRDRGLAANPDKLVEDDPLILSYHNGPVLSGDSILVYVIYYGNFTNDQRSMISDFLNSFQSHEVPSPSVADWWALTAEYRDGKDEPVSDAVQLGGERSDTAYSKGKTLKIKDIEDLILGQVRNRKFPMNHQGIYIVLTSHDVEVEDFCKNQCASHFATKPLDATDGRHLVYAWAGNAIKQCPSRCVWPFAKPEYGPRTQQPLRPPNQDAGIDGMIINMAEMIAGAATNPFNSGYYQGDAAAPLEAATACAGIFGEGAYPGEPGKLLVDQKSGGSFNAHGIRDRKFMLPALWNPLDLQCTPPQSANNQKKND